jgi:hypothetical protein
LSHIGDHFVVNGYIWPKYEIQNTGWHRIRFLNGCDSRFLVINFAIVADNTVTELTGNETTIPYYIIGTDQGLVFEDADVLRYHDLVIAPGNRYDILIDFDAAFEGKRIIVTNKGGNQPFRGLGLPVNPTGFERMDRIMAFDIKPPTTKVPKSTKAPKGRARLRVRERKLSKGGPDWGKLAEQGIANRNTCTRNAVVNRVRRVALFEGNDEHGRLQPLLGTAEPATDFQGNSIDWPDTLPGGTCETGCDVGLCVTNDCDDTANCEGFDCSGCPYKCANLTGPIEGTAAWHTKTTENPALGSCEEWEICKYSKGRPPYKSPFCRFLSSTLNSDTHIECISFS